MDRVNRLLVSCVRRSIGLIASVGATLLAAPNAAAAEFHVWSCKTPSGAPALVDGWETAVSAITSRDADPGTALVNACTTGGPLRLLAGVDAIGPGPWPEGYGEASIGLAFKPVPGLSVRSLALRRAITAFNGGSIYSAVTLSQPSADGWSAIDSVVRFQVPGTLTRGSLDLADPTANVGIVPTTTTSGAVVNASVFCSGWAAPAINPNRACAARFELAAADIVLDDPSSPKLLGVAGRLTDAAGALRNATGLTGEIPIAIAASDEGSGVRSAVLLLDGMPVASADSVGAAGQRQRCASGASAADGRPAYELRQPCPLQASLELNWDTRSVADGEHALRIELRDAAGNVSVATTGRVSVRNAPGVGPGSAPQDRGGRNGSGADETATLTLGWPATARAPSRRPSVIKRCAGDARWAADHPKQCAGVPAAPRLTRGWSTKATDELSGQLLGPSGPIVGARIALTTKSSAVGFEARPFLAATTDTAGRFTIRVARAAGSRTIKATWAPFISDTAPVASAEAQLTVASATSVRGPARLRPAADAVFSGALSGQSGARGGVPITLDVRYRGRWRTFATSSTDVRGRWRIRVRRFATAPGRYEVRARTGVSAVYPYDKGRGNRSVTVRVG